MDPGGPTEKLTGKLFLSANLTYLTTKKRARTLPCHVLSGEGGEGELCRFRVGPRSSPTVVSCRVIAGMLSRHACCRVIAADLRPSTAPRCNLPHRKQVDGVQACNRGHNHARMACHAQGNHHAWHVIPTSVHAKWHICMPGCRGVRGMACGRQEHCTRCNWRTSSMEIVIVTSSSSS